jgi:hypothetical protein
MAEIEAAALIWINADAIRGGRRDGAIGQARCWIDLMGGFGAGR